MKLPNIKFDDLASQILEMNYAGIARAISICEKNDLDGFLVYKALGAFNFNSHVIGVTGAPGVGKSTLIDCIAYELLSSGESVAVLAIDPSLYKQSGAFLGDRVRMKQSQSHPNFFLRSISARGMLGGVNPSFVQILLVLIAAKFSHIIIETVGVGQNENLIKDYVQTTIAVHSPEQGDEIQYLKGGITYLGDIHVINKADIPGAERVLSIIQSVLEYQENDQSEGKCSRIFLTQAKKGLEISELVNKLRSEAQLVDKAEYESRLRHSIIQEYKALHERFLISNTVEIVLDKINWEDEFREFSSVNDFERLNSTLESALCGKFPDVLSGVMVRDTVEQES